MKQTISRARNAESTKIGYTFFLFFVAWVKLSRLNFLLKIKEIIKKFCLRKVWK